MIQIGADDRGAPVQIDVEELLATRLLVQGNSGSGKSHLLRRLLEESAGVVQQIVIDPEGDFVTLADEFGHVVIDGAAYTAPELTRLAARIRKHRASVVLALDNLEVEAQMRCAALFLSALFDAPHAQWFPALVVVDEAQLFAPASGGEVNDEVRRMSLGAMTNLMCRGRKRGLAGIVATQRLAKLAKNVAAEASNFLMGRTFLDIDMARAADLLGMERRQAEQIRDLARGQFLGLGPAISRRPVSTRIGPVRTGAKSTAQALAPLPTASSDELHALLHDGLKIEERVVERPAMPLVPAAEELISRIEAPSPTETAAPAATLIEAIDTADAITTILAEMAAVDGATYKQAASLYQDFSLRCRQQRIHTGNIDLVRFRRLFALAVAGVSEQASDLPPEIMQLTRGLSDDLIAPFLLIARAALAGEPCPDDEELGRVYGTSSPGRIRRLLEHMEKSGLITVRTDFSGRRTVIVSELGLATAEID